MGARSTPLTDVPFVLFRSVTNSASSSASKHHVRWRGANVTSKQCKRTYPHDCMSCRYSRRWDQHLCRASTANLDDARLQSDRSDGGHGLIANVPCLTIPCWWHCLIDIHDALPYVLPELCLTYRLG
jgi:hypothetical protein